MNPLYDPRAALPYGQVLQRDAEAALIAAYDGTDAITSAQAVAACGAPLPQLATIPRFPGEGWRRCADDEDVCVSGTETYGPPLYPPGA